MTSAVTVILAGAALGVAAVPVKSPAMGLNCKREEGRKSCAEPEKETHRALQVPL